MEFTPRHSQPFTIQQAIGFDVSVINEGVANQSQQNPSNRRQKLRVYRIRLLIWEKRKVCYGSIFPPKDTMLSWPQFWMKMKL